MSEQPQEWTTEWMEDNLPVGGLTELELEDIRVAHNAALAAAWQEHNDVVDALGVSNKTITQVVAVNRELKKQLDAEREASRKWKDHWQRVAEAHECKDLTDVFAQLTVERDLKINEANKQT